jgi:hypothetical protein
VLLHELNPILSCAFLEFEVLQSCLIVHALVLGEIKCLIIFVHNNSKVGHEGNDLLSAQHDCQVGPHRGLVSRDEVLLANRGAVVDIIGKVTHLKVTAVLLK